MTSPERPPFVDKAIVALEHGQEVADRLGRSDLVSRLKRAQVRLELPEVTVVVAGEFKQGKSSLVNALLNTDLCPVHDDVSTVVPTVVRHGVNAAAAVVRVGDPGSSDEAVAEPVIDSVSVSDVADFAAELGNPGNQRQISAVEVRVPRQLLESGLVVVDTPGVGGLRSVQGAATETLLSSADVVIFVTDASQELTRTELEFLQRARSQCPNVVCVVTKIDLYLDWRRIVELDLGHLEYAGTSLEVMPVSSLLRARATARGDRALNEESGYHQLVSWLKASVLSQRQRLAVRSAGSDLAEVARMLAAPLKAELAVLDDPENADEVVAELDLKREKAQDLLAQTSRWQQLLTDGGQDLASEVDHDLRRRLREITTEATSKLEDEDPASIWDEFSVWLEQQVAEAVSDNNRFLVEQSSDLAERVGDLFESDGEGLIDTSALESGSEPVLPELAANFDDNRGTAMAGALTAMRGSYGGVLMFGMVAQLAGLALLNPLTVIVGLGLGRRALTEERKRNRTVAQQKAKAAVTKYVDQASFLANKNSKDLVRRIQRELRDTYRDRAKEVENSTKAALAAAQAASHQTETESRNRRSEIAASLQNVERVQANASALMSLPVEGMGR